MLLDRISRGALWAAAVLAAIAAGFGDPWWLLLAPLLTLAVAEAYDRTQIQAYPAYGWLGTLAMTAALIGGGLVTFPAVVAALEPTSGTRAAYLAALIVDAGLLFGAIGLNRDSKYFARVPDDSAGLREPHRAAR